MTSFFQKNSLIVYFLLSYVLSWIFWIPLIIITSSPSFDQNLNPVYVLPLAILAACGIFGPALSAFIVTGIEKGKEGLYDLLTRLFKWRIAAPWYLATLGLPMSLYLGAVVLNMFLGGLLPVLSSVIWYEIILLFLYFLFVGGGLEEPGWRGYALPKLQTRYSPIKSSLILGLLWTLWHLPLYFIPGSTKSPSSLPGFIIMGLAMTFIFTWMYNNTESIFVVILFHTLFNFLPGLLLPPNDQTFGAIYLALLWITVITIILIFGTTLHKKTITS